MFSLNEFQENLPSYEGEFFVHVAFESLLENIETNVCLPSDWNNRLSLVPMIDANLIMSLHLNVSNPQNWRNIFSRRINFPCVYPSKRVEMGIFLMEIEMYENVDHLQTLAETTEM